MIRLSFMFALIFVETPRADAGDAEHPRMHQIRLNGHVFTLPEGFDVELAAGPPLVDRPIVADFDEMGRLYVADSSGSSEPVTVQLQKKPHRIVRLDAADADGRFRRRTVFADRMMFPEGAMWRGGSLYVAAPPSIWKLTDTDGDGVAEERVEWFPGKTLTGCANDLHGPYAGPDGWVYWCKGAFARQTYDLRDQGVYTPRSPRAKTFVTRAAHIFRCRVDGTGIEPVMTGGMDNPVAVVFTPGGERIFTTTFLQHPGGGRRDGLIHAVYGGVYGKDHDVIYEHPWTGPGLMPVMTHLGPAAPAGLVRYESSAFGPEYRDNLFAALFNLHKVTRHVLIPDGATFRTRDEDFLVSDNLDFHPTDVREDADGSLLVIDTGGWYKLCCPTSQLHKPDILGAIYRVRRTGAVRVEDPRGLKLPWAKMSAGELTRLLGDPRPAVRHRARETLANRGEDAVVALRANIRGLTPPARREAVWTATRISHAGARSLVRDALADPDQTVRQVALHSVALWRDREAGSALLEMLRRTSAQNHRAAAEALGRIADRAAVPAVLKALGQPADRVLEHSLTYALIEMGDAHATAAGLKSRNALTRRAALTALDQMPDGGLPAEAVTAELASSDAHLQETAWWIAGRHPEWGPAVAGFLRDRLAAEGLSAAEQESLVGRLARFAATPEVQALMAERLGGSPPARTAVLRAMSRCRLKQTSDAWLGGLVRVLTEGDGDFAREAVGAARSLPWTAEQAARLKPALLQIATRATSPVDVRLGALAAVPGGLTEVAPPVFDFLRARLASDQPVADRATAADILARAQLGREQLLALTESLKTAGPTELDRLLDAFGRSSDDEVGRKLIAELVESPARSSLRADALRPKLAKFGPTVQQEAKKLYTLLDADTARQRARLEELLGSLGGGDIRRGQAVFRGAKASCSACHAIGYLGGDVGPDLTKIGSIRSERDLLESIVFPSASLVRGYEPVQVTTRDGKVYNGLVRPGGADELVLATGANQQVRIPRADVEEVLPSRVSVMPAGLDQQLTTRELADLVAFLKACR